MSEDATPLITSVRAWFGRLLSRPSKYLSAEWERLAPRERRMISALAVGLVVLVGIVTVYLSFSTITELQEGNAEIREALAAIAKHRDEYLEAKSKSASQEARIGQEPPQITAELEAAARDTNVQIAETTERPTTPVGRKYVQHDVDVKVRQVDLKALADFMRRIETGPRLIFFSRLSVKRRFSEADKLDVELTATAFERVRQESPRKKPEEQTSK